MNGFGLEFVEFPGQHTGFCIADKVKSVIQTYGLEDKIIAIVVDNASNNDMAMGELSTFLRLNENTFPTPEELHVRCFGHVMNLGCKGEL